VLQTSWSNVILSDGTSVGLGIDVTERRRAEAELNRLAEIIEAASDFIGTADTEGRVTYVNRAGRVFFGLLTDAEVLNTRIADCHPDWSYRLLAEEGIPAAVRDGTWTGDTALVARGGREIQVSQLLISHRNAQGDVEFLSTIIRDITERKRAEQSLRFDRALFEGLQTAAPVGLGFVDWNTCFIRANQALADINGLPVAAHIGRPVAEVVPDLWPALESIYRRVLEQGEVVANVELAGETPAKPGVRRHWLAGYYPLRVGGEVVAAGIVIQEITERIRAEDALRESERRLELALIGAEAGSWDWDLTTGRMRHDDRWAGVFGPDPDAMIPDFAGWVAAIHPEDRERAIHLMSEHLNGATPFYEAEYRIMTGDGRWAWIVSRGRVLERDADGHALRFAGMYRDISPRRALQERLKRQEEQLLHVQRLTTAGELVAIVGHEINQPLSAISNFLGGALLRYQPALAENPGLAEAIGEALRLSRRAAEVVSGLRDLVRGHASRKEWVRVPALVRDSLLLAEAELRRRHIDLELDVPPDLPPLWAQRVFLQQLLLNLLLNAMEAMQAVPAELRKLKVRAVRTADGEIALSVADSGPGIPPTVAATLFEPFVSTKPEGIGLGLSVCRAIAEAHGGRIEVESPPGRGAVLTIRIPLHGE
jgi:PAS domain S-box-containing protein